MSYIHAVSKWSTDPYNSKDVYFLIQKQYTTIYEHILEDILNTTYISVYWYCKYLFQVGVNVDFCLAKRQIQIYTVLLWRSDK